MGEWNGAGGIAAQNGGELTARRGDGRRLRDAAHQYACVWVPGEWVDGQGGS